MMRTLTDPGFLLVLISILFVVSTAVFVIRIEKKELIHHAFLVMLVAVLLWALGALVMLNDHLLGAPVQRWAFNLAYIGLILSPIAVFFVGLSFARVALALTPLHLLTLVIPALSIVLLLTNDQHHLFYLYYNYEQLTASSALGPYFIVHTVYSYLLISVGMGFLMYFSIKNAGFFSRQSLLIFGGIILTLAVNALETFQFIHLGFHGTVISFSLSCLIFFLAIFKYDFLSIVPIALQKVVDHISDSFMVFDQNDVLIDYNKTFLEAFGSEAQITRKLTLAELTDRVAGNSSLHTLLRRFRHCISQHRRFNLEQTLQVNGETRHFSIEVTPLFTRGRFVSTIVLLKDITQIREALESLQKNHEILMEKERLASLGQLIGGIAHNLKTPIMSISGGVEGLKDLIEEYRDSIGDRSVSDQDHREIASEMLVWIDKIKPHCTYMSDIITTVKGQAVQFNTTDEMTFTLDELIHRVELLMKHELKRYHCELNIRYLTEDLYELKGEINSLVQIFDNLIINALQSYEGRQGQVDLTIEPLDDEIKFELRDFGSGISAVVREKLFREMITTKGKLGTGLGLYMSHATIRGKFGGRMWFDSEVGQGTTFHISLPYVHRYPRAGQTTEVLNHA